MSLAGTTRRLTAAERAREPRLLHVVAWFDGWAQAHGMDRAAFPRRLSPSEARAWRQGFCEGRREVLCHLAHGFAPCPGEHPRHESSGNTTDTR